MSLGVLDNFLWDVYKPEIRILFSYSFVKVSSKVSGWVLRLVIFNWLLLLIWNIHQVFVQYFFCWFLTCMYNIFWISVHWSWYLFSGVLANCQWGVSKPDIRFCFLRRFVEGHGKCSGFVISPVIINKLIGFKAVNQFGYCILLYKHHILLFLLLVL